MKKMTEHQIVSILKEAEVGIPVNELYRKYAIGNSTFYKWREKYGGMETSDIKPFTNPCIIILWKIS